MTIYTRQTTATGVTNLARPLTNAEGDGNFIDLQQNKLSTDLSNAILNYPSISPSLLLDFANTKTLDPRITFSRASTATYYDGKTFAKAEENLLSYSQEFDNAVWTKTDLTITANATAAPDGTTTADLVLANTNTGYHVCRQVYSYKTGIQVVFSFYAKPQVYTKVKFADLTNGTYAAEFDLTLGTVIGTSGTPGCTASITKDATTGWCRCVVVHTPATDGSRGAGFIGYPDTGATLNQYGAQYTGDGTSGIYIWGAQLEQRSSATAYTPTTAQPITNYIPVLQTAAANTPRFDHNPTTGESLGLLIEEQRTNLLTRSQEFDDASWVKARGSITANATVSPDGTLTADKFIADTQINPHFPYQTPSKSSGAAYTLTCFAKAGEWDSVALFSEDSTIGVGFNLLTGQYVSTLIGSPTGYSITPVGNGWYRVSMSFTSTTTAGQIAFRAGLAGDYGAAGNNYSGIYIWGAQLEAGSFPTSYIPTTTAQVTRSADAASMTGSNFSSWYRQDAGTLYADFLKTDTQSKFVVGLGFNSTNYVGLGYTGIGTGGAVYIQPLVSNLAGTPTYNQNAPSKQIVSYSAAGASASVNGSVAAEEAASGVLPSGTNGVLLIGSSPFNGLVACGTIKRIAYYPSRLSNSVIQALTT